MTVKASPLANDRPRAESHYWTADQLSRHESGALRTIAALVWLFSYAGNVLAVVPIGELALDDHTRIAMAFALAWQLVISALQFIFCRRIGPYYLLALLASALPSYLGYRPLVLDPWLASIAAGRAIADMPMLDLAKQIGVYCAYVVALVAADVWPERVFVRH